MTHAIACEDAVRRLWEYLDGSLSAEDVATVEAHLAFCVRCCGELEFSRHLRSVINQRARETLPESVEQRLNRFIDTLDLDAAGLRTTEETHHEQ